MTMAIFMYTQIKNEIKVKIEGITMLLERNENNEFVLIIDNDASEILENMEREENINLRGYGDTYYIGDLVHCNCFNGPASNNIHYQNWDPRASVNFTGSDCFLAILNLTN